MFRSQELIIDFDKSFSSNIMYLNVFLVFDSMFQIHYSIVEEARFMNLFDEFIRKYNLEERYT